MSDAIWAEDTYCRTASSATDPLGVVAAVDEPDEDVGEIEIADYLVFLFALDTYMRYIEESSEVLPDLESSLDLVLRKGLALLRVADRVAFGALERLLRERLTSKGSLKMLDAVMRTMPTARGAAMRALRLRTILSRGGSATAKAVFGTSNRARREVLDAIEATMEEDADAALNKFAAITLRNKRVEKWIDQAAAAAVPLVPLPGNPVQEAANKVTGQAAELQKSQVTREGAGVATEDAAAETSKQKEVLRGVEEDAREAAKKSLQQSGDEDRPLTKSEVIGVATAVAVAQAADPDNPRNVPPAFINGGFPLDAEQQAAALTDGRVLVAAGAGAGKSTTLVSRIAYLIQERNVPPNRIMAVTFNRKAANELITALQKKLGDAGSQVACDTMHTLFKRFIIGNPNTRALGTREEQNMLGPKLIATPQQGRGRGEDQHQKSGVSPSAVAAAIRGIWKDCGPAALANFTGFPEDIFEEKPKSKKSQLYISRWQGNDVSLDDAKANARSRDEQRAAVWYNLYLGLKGDLGGGWRPPCGMGKSYQEFMKKHRPGGERLGDMDDMLKVLRDILRRDVDARKFLQGAYDHILVDECQDLNTVQHQIFEMLSEHIAPESEDKSIWMVGDDKQCCHEATPVTMENGKTCLARDLKPGDKVLSLRNGSLCGQVIRHVIPSDWDHGFQIRTASGRELTVSPNHKLWATEPVLDEDRVLVYLMYRKGFGFRVGITNRHDPEHNYGKRPVQERADRLWVLEVCPSREDALLEEESYSLSFGIPTQVFAGTERGLNQERINELYAKFGSNGEKLLQEKHLSFDLPHWFSCGTTRGCTERRLIHLVAHGSKGSHVRMEWSGDDLDEILTKNDISFQIGKLEGYRRLRKWFTSYRVALDFAAKLASLTSAPVRERLSVNGDSLNLLPAAGLLTGMSLPIQEGDEIALDPIVSIERVKGRFIDLDVDDASNFFGGGILSHNSIYQFRGAKPKLFQALKDKPGWKTRMIRTNYRCPPEVIEHANKLISLDEDRIPMDSQPSPYRKRGEAGILVSTPADNTEAAINTLDAIRKDLVEGGDQVSPADYAVLSRTRMELNDFETACIINEIPYIRQGGKGFLDAPETKCVLGYMDLAVGTDYAKMRKSLASALLKPDRGLYLPPDEVEKIVDETFDDIARRERVSIDSINPTEVLNQRQYARMLADNLKKRFKLKIIGRAKNPRTGEWVYNKFVDALTEQIQEMGLDVDTIREKLLDPTLKTSDLLDGMLDNIKSTIYDWDPVARREVPRVTTLRDQISNDVDAYGDDEDEDEEETAPDSSDAPVEFDEEGHALRQEKELKKKGLGSIQFLYELAKQNPNDLTHGTDPEMAEGFQKKLARYEKLASTLRVDPVKWAKEQKKLPADQRTTQPQAVTLSTVHSVKGAQWKNVTVLMPKGKFPLEPKPKPGEAPPSEEEMKEQAISERNLGYVALTRAASNLAIVALADPKTGALSPYIAQAGLVPGENVPKPESGAPPEAPGEGKTASYDPHDDVIEQMVLRFASETPDLDGPTYGRM